MYYQYFGLQEPPFSIAVNPRYLYMSPRHRDALAHLLYGVGAGGGFILLTGEVGTGKTTLNRCLIEQLPDSADIAVVLNPALDSRDLLATVCEELAIELPVPPGEAGLKVLTDALHRFLIDNHARGRKTVLMIDEAQHLDFQVLEQIRLLTNLETHEEKLLHIILIGQPELAHKLARPELRQLNQRITARFDLQPLTAGETAAYIRHRLEVAGMPGGRELFAERLTRDIHRQSRGIPRLINLLCDRMLLGAYGRGAPAPDRSLLRSAAREVLAADTAAVGWRLPLLLLTAAVLVALALWSLWPSDAPPQRPELTVPTVTPAVSPPVSPAPEEPAREELRPGAWILSPRDGVRFLAALYEVEVSGERPCALPSGNPLRCVQGEADTWDALQRVGRPLLLELRDPQRFAATALFLGLRSDQAVLADAAGLRDVPLAALAELWTGRYWYYWAPVADWNGALSEGDSSPAVAAIARLFAELDGQAQPLAAQRFTAALGERVRIFQRSHGLTVDGVVGEETLGALQLAVGRAPGQVAVRDAIAVRAAAGQWP
jgi:general secretion pathway protein A